MATLDLSLWIETTVRSLAARWRHHARGCDHREYQAEPLERRVMIDAEGPYITALTPTEVRNAAFDHVDIAFSEPIAPLSFTAEDVVITGVAGTVPVTGVEALTNSSYRVTFTALATRGLYRISIGPNITDAAGNLMDQNQDEQPDHRRGRDDV